MSLAAAWECTLEPLTLSNMPTTTFKILNLECLSCAMEMEGICEEKPGVKKAEVNTMKQTIKVEHENTVDPTSLKKALDDEGYPVEALGQN